MNKCAWVCSANVIMYVCVLWCVNIHAGHVCVLWYANTHTGLARTVHDIFVRAYIWCKNHIYIKIPYKAVYHENTKTLGKLESNIRPDMYAVCILIGFQPALHMRLACILAQIEHNRTVLVWILLSQSSGSPPSGLARIVEDADIFTRAILGLYWGYTRAILGLY